MFAKVDNGGNSCIDQSELTTLLGKVSSSESDAFAKKLSDLVSQAA